MVPEYLQYLLDVMFICQLYAISSRLNELQGFSPYAPTKGRWVGSNPPAPGTKPRPPRNPPAIRS